MRKLGFLFVFLIFPAFAEEKVKLDYALTHQARLDAGKYKVSHFYPSSYEKARDLYEKGVFSFKSEEFKKASKFFKEARKIFEHMEYNARLKQSQQTEEET